MIPIFVSGSKPYVKFARPSYANESVREGNIR